MIDRRNSQFFGQGIIAALPFSAGAAAFGLVFGALAVSNGIPPLAAIAMSILVSAGSAEIAAAGLFGDGASLPVILTAVFLINLRNVFYSASLSALFKPFRWPWAFILAHVIFDETFGLTVARAYKKDLTPKQTRLYYLGAGALLVTAWYSATALGALIGAQVPNGVADILGLVAPLVLIGLIVPLLASWPLRLAALSAAIGSIFFAPLPHSMGLLLGSAAGIVVGILLERRQRTAAYNEGVDECPSCC